MSGSKAKGNAAFKSANWGDAVTFYSRAMEENPKDFTCVANRSAAYLKKGDYDKAVEDANECLDVKPNYPKAHINKASALMAQKDYDGAVRAYEKGLAACPTTEEGVLQKGLLAAKHARTANSKASQLAHKTLSTRKAAMVRTKKAQQAGSIRSYVEQTQLNVELQMASLQAQFDMVLELGQMRTMDKLDLLFYLFDENRRGSLEGKKLAVAMRRHQTTSTSTSTTSMDADSFLSSNIIQKGIERLDHDPSLQLLGPDDFVAFCQSMVQDLDTTLDDFAEFLTYQYLFEEESTTTTTSTTTEDDDKKDSSTTLPPSTAAVAASDGDGGPEEEDKDTNNRSPSSEQVEGGATTTTDNNDKIFRNDNRMRSLFVLFDKDGDSLVSFKEVAVGLYQLTHSMEEASKNAASLLLMMDQDDKRELEYEQFSKLILAVGAASKRNFDDLYDELILALTSEEPLSEEILRQITIADEAYEKALEKERQISEENTNKKVTDALTNSRAQSLFELWDANGDGTIDFQELLTGLRRYQSAKHGSKNMASIEKQALMMIGHDEDSNQTLDQEEFAAAMINYAEAVSEDLHDLIDFMCVISTKHQEEEESVYEKAFIQSSFQRKSIVKPSRMMFGHQSLGTIVDIEMDEEDEEDDW